MTVEAGARPDGADPPLQLNWRSSVKLCETGKAWAVILLAAGRLSPRLRQRLRLPPVSWAETPDLMSTSKPTLTPTP
ncbi:MAG: hypothetical protein AB1894_23960 [Chloroflexota bacterium]